MRACKANILHGSTLVWSPCMWWLTPLLLPLPFIFSIFMTVWFLGYKKYGILFYHNNHILGLISLGRVLIRDLELCPFKEELFLLDNLVGLAPLLATLSPPEDLLVGILSFFEDSLLFSIWKSWKEILRLATCTINFLIGLHYFLIPKDIKSCTSWERYISSL